jgi:hypothetical protein
VLFHELRSGVKDFQRELVGPVLVVKSESDIHSKSGNKNDPFYGGGAVFLDAGDFKKVSHDFGGQKFLNLRCGPTKVGYC